MMKKEKKPGVAVIGTGMYGDVHIRGYLKDGRVNLVSVWSRSKERARETGKKYGCNWTTDLKEIAEDKRIQMVSVVTPDFAHAGPALAMLKAGKHLLLEKPMSMNVVECEEIIAAAKKAKKKLMINFHNRWYPPFSRAKELIDAGEIGDVAVIYARLSDIISVATKWLPWAGQSGPEWFLFPHLIDLVRWLVGKEVKRVYGVGRKGLLSSKGLDIYDVIQAQIEFGNTIATIESSWILPDTWPSPVDFKFDILGEKGRLGIIGDREGIEITSNKHQWPFILDPFTTEKKPFEHFIDCVLNDKEPSVTGEDGLAVTKIIVAILKSIKEGKPVEI